MDKFSYSIICPDLIQKIWDQYPELKQYSYRQIQAILKGVNKKITDYTIDNRDGVDMPLYTGHLFIGSYDYRNSAKYKKYAAKSSETDGYGVRIFYSTSRVSNRSKNISLWGFIPYRSYKKKVADISRKNWKRYAFVRCSWHMDAFIRKQRIIEYMNKKNKKKLETYDEFSFDD